MADTRYYVAASPPPEGGKGSRRIGLTAHGEPRWFGTGKVTDRTVPESKLDDVKAWAKKNRKRLTITVVNPYPWLVLASHTKWPTPELCRRLNLLGQRLKRKLYLREGLRSRDQQRDYWVAALQRYGNEHEAGKWVARPYTSRHGTGLAADVGVGAFYGPNLFDYPGVRQAAAAVGLVQPMSWEPWHVEMPR